MAALVVMWRTMIGSNSAFAKSGAGDPRHRGGNGGRAR